MVHALKEVWRVLVPNGQVIDLRPISENAPIEVVVGDQVLFAGRRIDCVEGIADDIAANEAIESAVGSGWFVQEYAGSFKYNTYWNTLAEMKIYAEENYTSSYIPEEAFIETHRLMAENGKEAKVRIHRTISISQYRKRFFNLHL